MRKLLVLGAAIVAVLSLATIAQGQDYDDSHVWFFGNCENQYENPDTITSTSLFLGGSCRGIGLFLGDWDPESIASKVSYEAMDEFGGNWEVDYLKAINIFGGQTDIGSSYGCGLQDDNALQPATLGGGLWIAIFSVVPCEVEPFDGVFAVAYTDMDENDGPYNPAVDTLIAMVTDDDNSETLSVGDLVTTYQYPLDFDFGTAGFGAFQVTGHVVTSVNFYTATALGVSAGTFNFQFARTGDYEEYTENDNSSGERATFQDGFNEPSWTEYLEVDSGAPSAPATAVPDATVDNSTDDPFVDVEVRLVGNPVN